MSSGGGAGGGDQPTAKRQKTYNADGPVEDDQTAREKLREAGFDPEDVHTARSDLEAPERCGSWYNITPMAYFASHGDLPMCRYLLHARGATTRMAAIEHRASPGREIFWYPIYAAVVHEHVDVSKWLFQNGAKVDAVRTFSICFPKENRPFSSINQEKIDRYAARTDLAKWFILNGAMENDEGIIDVERVLAAFQFFRSREVSRWVWEGEHGLKAHLVDWCSDLLQNVVGFHTFLLGTIPTPGYSVEALKQLCAKKLGNACAASLLIDGANPANYRTIWDTLARKPAANSCFESFPGVLQNIADYVGLTRSKSKLNNVREFHEIISTITAPSHYSHYTDDEGEVSDTGGFYYSDQSEDSSEGSDLE